MIKFDINQALVINELPSIEQNFSTRKNLCFFKNATDLVNNNKFPKLVGNCLNLIGICQAELINYKRIRKPAHPGEPFGRLCKLDWTIFGLDSHLKSKPRTRCNFVCVADDMLEKKVDFLLHESFAEKPHDFNQALSVNDKIVLNKYRNSI